MDLYGQPELAYVKCDCFKVTLKMCFMQIKKFILVTWPDTTLPILPNSCRFYKSNFLSLYHPFANDLLLFNMTLTIVQSLQCHTIIKLCLCKD